MVPTGTAKMEIPAQMILLSRLFGAFVALLGLALNKWTLERTIDADGIIDGSLAEAAIVAVQVSVVAVGVWIVLRARRFRAPSAAKCLLVLASSALAFGLIEVTVHFMQNLQHPYAHPPDGRVGQRIFGQHSNFTADNQTGWRMRASQDFLWAMEGHSNGYRSNAQGFRSERDFDERREPMIAVTGDSFTWGYGVEYRQTFGDLLEKRLEGNVVYNFAMPGFGVDQMWMSIRHQALPLHPALVVVAFIDEDFERSLTAYRINEGFYKPRFIVDSGTLRPQTAEDASGGIAQALYSHSLAWKLMADTLAHLRPLGEWWVLNTAMFEAIAEDSRRAGVPVLIVRLPVKQNSHHVFKSLADRLQSRNIAFLDLAGPNAPADIYFEHDGHINPAGHSYVMESIASWIEGHLPRLAEHAAVH